MIPELREHYNSTFREEKFLRFRQRLDDRLRLTIPFNVCETPLFVPLEMQKTCEKAAIELALAAHDPDYLAQTDRTLRPEITVAGQTDRAMFLSVDFALALDREGNVVPRLIELQGFPSLMGYQLFLCELFLEHFALPTDLQYINGGLTRVEYLDLLRRSVVADENPEQVVLLEYDPWSQKTCPDFQAYRELLGIEVVDIRNVVKRSRRLFYLTEEGEEVPIRRIFNRAIVDELERKNVDIPFAWNDELDVTWAGHPNWFFRISKFTLPFLNHPLVPRAFFLSDLPDVPDNLENYVLKPLFSFAGTGVIVSPSAEDIRAIPDAERTNYILQERIELADAVMTPFGGTRAELRVMLIWPDDEPEPTPAMGLVRMGRGEKMGVTHNLSTEGWIGASCNLFR
jgi:hypothetical protein